MPERSRKKQGAKNLNELAASIVGQGALDEPRGLIPVSRFGIVVRDKFTRFNQALN